MPFRAFTYARSVSATTPPPSPDPETTPEEYLQRALLFADLGRYADAAEEIAAGLAAAPTDSGLLTTLARVHLAADQPADALVAAERAVAAAPGTVNPLVVRAMARTDTTRYAEAAVDASEVLRRWPDDPYAQRTGAALLSESRNGQEALNAAWQGVRIAPEEAEAHLVLAVVAARLRLFELAQRAYGEALDLDPDVGEAQRDVGIVRLERRRWALALESLADDASLDQSAPPAGTPPDRRGYPSPFPRPYRSPGPAEIAAVGDTPDFDPYPEPAVSGGRGWFEPMVSRPAGPVLDRHPESVGVLRQAVLFDANATLIAAVIVAAMTVASVGASRVWAGMIGVLLLVAVPIWLARKLSQPAATVLARLRGADRRLAVATYLGFVAPVPIVLYAAVGGVTPLVASMILAVAAELLVVTQRR